VGNPNADMAARTRVNATTTKLVNNDWYMVDN